MTLLDSGADTPEPTQPTQPTQPSQPTQPTPPSQPTRNSWDNWDDLEREALACTKCPLATQGRTQVVFGVGSRDADLVFVGEGPGAEEDKQGIPFVGRAGQLLTRLIDDIGMTRDDVYIANVVKCRPPGNRDPQPIEIETCRPYLEAQLELLAPRDRHARKLRDEAPARHEGRHHEATRSRAVVCNCRTSGEWFEGGRRARALHRHARADVASVGGAP